MNNKRHAPLLLIKKAWGFLWLTFIFFVSSCTYDQALEVEPLAAEEMRISYQEDIQPIIATHCYSCHSVNATHPEKPGYAFLDDYEGLMRYALKTSVSNPAYTTLQARLRFIEFPGMPFKEEPLPESEIQKIETWIKMGAPNN